MLTDYIHGLDLCHFGLFYSRKRTGNKFAPHTLSDLSSKLGQLHFSTLLKDPSEFSLVRCDVN